MNPGQAGKFYPFAPSCGELRVLVLTKDSQTKRRRDNK